MIRKCRFRTVSETVSYYRSHWEVVQSSPDNSAQCLDGGGVFIFSYFHTSLALQRLRFSIYGVYQVGLWPFVAEQSLWFLSIAFTRSLVFVIRLLNGFFHSHGWKEDARKSSLWKFYVHSCRHDDCLSFLRFSPDTRALWFTFYVRYIRV